MNDRIGVRGRAPGGGTDCTRSSGEADRRFRRSLKYNAAFQIDAKMATAARQEITKTHQDHRRRLLDFHIREAADWVAQAAIVTRAAQRERLSTRNESRRVCFVSIVKQQAGADVEAADEVLIVV